MKQYIVLTLMFLSLLGQIPAFVRAMKNKQTARSWFMGFVIALLAGCWWVYWLQLQH